MAAPPPQMPLLSSMPLFPPVMAIGWRNPTPGTKSCLPWFFPRPTFTAQGEDCHPEFPGRPFSWKLVKAGDKCLPRLSMLVLLQLIPTNALQYLSMPMHGLAIYRGNLLSTWGLSFHWHYRAHCTLSDYMTTPSSTVYIFSADLCGCQIGLPHNKFAWTTSTLAKQISGLCLNFEKIFCHLILPLVTHQMISTGKWDHFPTIALCLCWILSAHRWSLIFLSGETGNQIRDDRHSGERFHWVESSSSSTIVSLSLIKVSHIWLSYTALPSQYLYSIRSLV